ncbi:MAG: hypothetical protein QM535_10455 [Limnohabitans sp.]|nr:hypothetical protein [Limnohabitans sp.]
MKTNLKVLTLALISAMFMASCETEKANITPEQEPKATDWETNDAKLISEINSEIQSKVSQSKATISVYRNFKLYVDASTPSDIISLAKGEIDQMYVSGLKSTTLTKMSYVNGIYLAPTTSRGMYYTGGWVVINDYTTYRTVKQSTSSVVEHELTHYYHDKHLPSGFNNTTVASLFTSARNNAIYPLSSYVLSNRNEYLATSSEAYFSGTSRQPYNRTNVTTKDPNLKTFLVNNF